jgi:hypothetical protein
MSSEKISNYIHEGARSNSWKNTIWNYLYTRIDRHLGCNHIGDLLLQSELQPLVGFRPDQLSLSILRRFYRVPLPAARQTPNLEENQGFRAFQLSPQEALSFWSDASEPSSGRWKYGWEMAEKFCRKWRLPRHFLVLLHAVKHDMGQTPLLPLRRKACWGFCRPKNPTASAGFEPVNLGTKGQHATSRPPKPLLFRIIFIFYVIFILKQKTIFFILFILSSILKINRFHQ